MEEVRIYMDDMRCFRVFSNPMPVFIELPADGVLCEDSVVVEHVQLDGLEMFAIEFPAAA